MKNVLREPVPQILVKKADIWKKDLLAAVDDYKKNKTPMPKTLQSKYRNKEVLDALKRMYCDEDNNNFCCFCESEIDIVDFPHIEHRMPKSIDKFPEHTFDWENFHLACEKCNNHKLDQWDIANPILDPVKDIPITDHLAYREDITGLYRDAISDRGVTTIEHADLNRKKLRTARLRIYFDVMKVIREILPQQNNPKFYASKQIMKNKAKGPHGSIITWLFEIYGISL